MRTAGEGAAADSAEDCVSISNSFDGSTLDDNIHSPTDGLEKRDAYVRDARKGHAARGNSVAGGMGKEPENWIVDQAPDTTCGDVGELLAHEARLLHVLTTHHAGADEPWIVQERVRTAKRITRRSTRCSSASGERLFEKRLGENSGSR